MLNYPTFNPILIQIGPIAVHWYGLMYMVGFLSAHGLGYYRASQAKSHWTKEQVQGLLFYGTLGVFIGGRLGYVLFYDLPYFLSHPGQILATWNGGMSFHGGLIGVLISFALSRYKIQKTFFELTDFTAPLVPLGILAGRIGNFINGELWGRPTDLPWGMVFPGADHLARHPSQLYEAVLEGLFLFILVWQYSRTAKPICAVSGVFAIGYGVCRFIAEYFREPDAHLGFIINHLTMGQCLSLPLILLGIGLLYHAFRTRIS